MLQIKIILRNKKSLSKIWKEKNNKKTIKNDILSLLFFRNLIKISSNHYRSRGDLINLK